MSNNKSKQQKKITSQDPNVTERAKRDDIVDIELKDVSDDLTPILKEERSSPAPSSRASRYDDLQEMLEEHTQVALDRHNALATALQQQNDKIQLQNDKFQQQNDEIRGLLMDLLQQNRNSNEVPPAKQEVVPPPLLVQDPAPSKVARRRNHEESKVQVKVEDPPANSVRSRSTRQPPQPLSTPAPEMAPSLDFLRNADAQGNDFEENIEDTADKEYQMENLSFYYQDHDDDIPVYENLQTNRPSPFSSFKSRPNKSRRDSIMHRLSIYQPADKFVRIVREPPKQDHIKLTKLNIPSILDFFDNVELYQKANNIPIQMATKIEPNLRDMIIAQCGQVEVTVDNFYSLENPIIAYLLHCCFRPPNAYVFCDKLIKFSNFNMPYANSSYKPTATDFQPFYKAMLDYRHKFKMLFDFLAAYTDDRELPKIHTKENGVISIFLSKIPNGIGTRMLHRMNKDLKKYDGAFRQFLDDFYYQLQQDYEISRESKILNDILFKPSTTDSFKVKILERTAARVNDLQSSHAAGLVNELLDNLLSSDPAAELHLVSKSDLVRKATSANEHSKAKSDRARMGCYKMAIYGICEKHDRCSYSHTTSDCEATALTKSRFLRMNNIQTKDKKTFHSHSQLTLDRPSTVTNRSAFVDFSDDQDDIPFEHEERTEKPLKRNDFLIEEDEEDDEFHHLINEEMNNTALAEVRRIDFLFNFPEAKIFTTMHRPGKIVLVNGSEIFLKKVLFDSGALHASYISESLVNKHRQVLKPYLKKARGLVKLGNNKTTVPVSEIAVLPLEFKDNYGCSHCADVELCVFESNSDIIIGLPDIASKFGDLFIGMVKNAVDIATDNTSNSNINSLTMSEANNIEDSSNLQSPWTGPPDDIAPEDEETPLPCAFPEEALRNVDNLKHEELKQEFYDQFEEHVHPDFRKKTKIIDLLKDKGEKVFDIL
jgi:hypothetical protein